MKNSARVALVRCGDYDQTGVDQALARAFNLLGGVKKFIGPGEAVLLKPNLLAPDPPSKAVTTHPAVFAAAARLFQAAGSAVSYGDSPGGGFPSLTARRAGLASEAKRLGVALADFVTPREVSFPQGRQNKKFLLARGVAEHAGALVNLPKLKTHGLLRATAAVKNLFGCVPGWLKAEFHLKLPDPLNFARMLVDLNLLLKPRLHILDGIVAMEGNGPRSGRPFPLGVLLVSSDPVALDATACRLLAVNPEYVPTITAGAEAGLGVYRERDIELLGEDWKSWRSRRFQAVRLPVPGRKTGGRLRWLRTGVVPRPAIDPGRCTRCGLCVQVCPVKPKAVAFRAGLNVPPVYDYHLCIRCYCCQELCPERAISLRTPLLGRLIRRR